MHSIHDLNLLDNPNARMSIKILADISKAFESRHEKTCFCICEKKDTDLGCVA